MNLNRHYSSFASNESPYHFYIKDGDSWYECKYCSARFKTAGNVFLHCRRKVREENLVPAQRPVEEER